MPPDGVIRDVRRPWLGPSLWAPLLLVLAACIGVVYYGHQVVLALEESVAASARAGGRATVNQIVGFIDREHERLRAFAEEKDEEIRRILNFPDDWPAIDALQTSVKRMFRGAFAFTVTGPDGAPLFEDFDGLVGPVCQASMRDYIRAQAGDEPEFVLPPIHPVPDAYHFDLITPWRLEDGQAGLFFVSMSPDRIAELLAAAEQASGNRIVLVNTDEPTLIEITSRGARDQLGGDFRLEADQLVAGHFAADLPGTAWRLVVLPDAAALQEAKSDVYAKVAASVVVLLLISAALLYLVRRAEKRNSGMFTSSLQASVSRQRAILQSMVDGMVTIDAAGTVLHVNSAITRMFGYEPGELIGSNVHILMPEPHRSAHDGYLKHYLDTGESHILGKGRELTARRKDGSLFPILLTLGESIEGDQHIFVGILHDMTAHKEAQDKLAVQARKIERTKHELDEISHVAANNLQLPLQRIASLGEMLANEHAADLSGVERDQLRTLGAEARDMSELARGIADYTRAEERPPVQIIDLEEVLDKVCNDLEARIEASGAVVRVQGSGQVRGNENQVRQLLWNLLDNALKFYDSERPPEVTITIDAEPLDGDGSPDRLRVRVRDNGIGIPEDQLDAVFEAFRRLHPRDAFPGMGLGLSFCRKIADNLGGEIHVSSRLGEGSEFSVTLPRAQ